MRCRPTQDVRRQVKKLDEEREKKGRFSGWEGKEQPAARLARRLLLGDPKK